MPDVESPSDNWQPALEFWLISEIIDRPLEQAGSPDAVVSLVPLPPGTALDGNAAAPDIRPFSLAGIQI